MIDKGSYRNNKTQNIYIVTGTCFNSTNAQNGQIMVKYIDQHANEYVRELGEFHEKFTCISSTQTAPLIPSISDLAGHSS